MLGRRYLAAVIDLGVLWLFSVTFWLLASVPVPPTFERLGVSPCRSGELCSDAGGRYVEGWPMALLLLVWAAYLVGVFVLQRGLTGRTVGTMLTGVVVVGADGRPLGPGRALVRSLAGLVDHIPCCLPLVGILTSATSTGHQRVGDMAARSYVVAAEGFGRPVGLPGPPAPPAPDVWSPPPTYPAQPPTAPVGRPPVAPFAPPAPAMTTGPVWDPERRAYLQWDPARGQWLQFDQATGVWQQYEASTGRWRPVDG